MIVLEPKPVRQARTRKRRARWFTAVLVVASVLALCVALWPTTLFTGWTVPAMVAGLVAGFWAGGRCIGKVDDPT